MTKYDPSLHVAPRGRLRTVELDPEAILTLGWRYFYPDSASEKPPVGAGVQYSHDTRRTPAELELHGALMQMLDADTWESINARLERNRRTLEQQVAELAKRSENQGESIRRLLAVLKRHGISIDEMWR